MEVIVSLGIIEANKSGRYYDFDMVAFYPGKVRVGGLGDGWKEVSKDISIMPVGHLIERSFKQDSMVVYKKPDFLSSQLMDAFQKGTLLSGLVRIYMKTNGQKSVQVGKYKFHFEVKQMLLNQTNENGDRWERMELSIVDETERVLALDE